MESFEVKSSGARPEFRGRKLSSARGSKCCSHPSLTVVGVGSTGFFRDRRLTARFWICLAILLGRSQVRSCSWRLMILARTSNLRDDQRNSDHTSAVAVGAVKGSQALALRVLREG